MEFENQTLDYILPEDKIVAIPLKPARTINSGIVTKRGRQIYSDEQKLINFLRIKYGNKEKGWAPCNISEIIFTAIWWLPWAVLLWQQVLMPFSCPTIY